MSWVKVDDKAWSHPKFIGLGAGAVRLWLFALCWVNGQETDGRVPRHALRVLGSSVKDANQLVAARLWAETEDGWVFHDYLNYQPSAEENKARREAKADAGRSGGKRSGEARRQNLANQTRSKTEAPASTLVEPKRTPDPDPDPDPGPTRSENPAGSELAAPEPTAEPTNEPKTPKRKPKRAIPPDWQPLPRHFEKAAEIGVNCALAATKFRAHAESVDRRCAEWNRAFDNWLTNERSAPLSRVLTPSGGFDPFERAKRLREAEEREQMAFTTMGAEA